MVAQRSEKACQYNEKIADRVEGILLLREERQEGIKTKLAQERYSKNLTERKEKASQYNEKVAERLREWKEWKLCRESPPSPLDCEETPVHTPENRSPVAF